MTKNEVISWLEDQVSASHEKETGNETADRISALMAGSLEANRAAVVGAIKQWISQQSERTLLAGLIAARCELHEVRPDLEHLLKDVRAGRAFEPYYEQFITSVLDRLR
jgi:hypothetical protein